MLDIEDYERLNGRGLSLGSHGYAQIWDSRQVQTVHAWITGLTGSGYRQVVDHENRDKLDNRRANLKVVSPSESNLNRPQMDGEFVGVYQLRSGRWQAKFRWRRKRYHAGTFDTREEARDALRTLRQSVISDLPAA